MVLRFPALGFNQSSIESWSQDEVSDSEDLIQKCNLVFLQLISWLFQVFWLEKVIWLSWVYISMSGLENGCEMLLLNMQIWALLVADGRRRAEAPL